MNKYILVIFLMLIVSMIDAQVDEAADEQLRLLIDQGNVGVSAGILVDGTVLWKDSKGFSSKEDMVLMSDRTITRIASISKSITAVVVMQLVEQGKLDLDQSIQSYIPDFPKKDKGDFQ